MSYYLYSDDPRLQDSAASTILDLAYNNQENQKAIREAGAISLLTKLLSSDVTDVQYLMLLVLLQI